MKWMRPYLLCAAVILSFAAYAVIGYLIPRSNFGGLIAAFTVAFCCYFWMLQQVRSSRVFFFFIAAAVLFRLLLVTGLPTLSDDFYRFIWDGNLFIHGQNPFGRTPQYLLEHGLPLYLSKALFNHLNSQAYYSVYPPISQFIYALGAAVAGSSLMGNVVVMKGVMVAADVSTFWVIKKLLDHFNLPRSYLLIYALNPLIILELTGNLHFEGVMIFCLLLSYYFLLNEQIIWGAIAFAGAVNTKLVPLLLLPYLVFSLGWRKSIRFIGILIVGTVLLHLPFLDQTFISHFGDSLRLYFQSFEYNASLFYVVRWIGFQVKGYDIIHSAAPKMAVISAVLIVGIGWVRRQSSLRNLPSVAITSLAVYYIFSTTVHPWYVSLLAAFVPFTGFIFPLGWSAVIPLTYITYTTSAYHQNFWLIALEYTIVFVVMSWDFFHWNDGVRKKMHRIFKYNTPFN